MGQSCLSDQKGLCILFHGKLLPFGPWHPETVTVAFWSQGVRCDFRLCAGQIYLLNKPAGFPD